MSKPRPPIARQIARELRSGDGQIISRCCKSCNGTGNIPSDAHVSGSMECACCLGRGWNYERKDGGRTETEGTP